MSSSTSVSGSSLPRSVSQTAPMGDIQRGRPVLQTGRPIEDPYDRREEIAVVPSRTYGRRQCAGYRRLSATGKKLAIVVAAIARKSAAFLWAIGRSHLRSASAVSSSRCPEPGAEHARWGTPAASYVAELWPDARPLDRGKPRDEDTEGGNQSADKSLINRRLSLRSQLCAP
jgi:hypothetical protein